MKIALAILLIPFSLRAASLTGTVVAAGTGDYLTDVAVTLEAGTRKYQAQTDDVGIYKFSNLLQGEYTLRFVTPGFKSRTVKSVSILQSEQKRLPDVALDVAGCGLTSRELILLQAEAPFGRLTGSVDPAVAEVEITLICRTFSACASTKTDAIGRFSFEMLSPGYYGLNFRHVSFYPEIATGYGYWVNAGWESVYSPVMLQECPNGNCDPKLRPQGPIQHCE